MTDDDCFPDDGWAEGLIGWFVGNSPRRSDWTDPASAGRSTKRHVRSVTQAVGEKTRLFSARAIPFGKSAAALISRPASTCFASLAGGMNVSAWALRAWRARTSTFSTACSRRAVDPLQRRRIVHHAGRRGSAAGPLDGQLYRLRHRSDEWSPFGTPRCLRLANAGSYSKMHLRELLREARRVTWTGVRERVTSLSALGPSLIYGFRAARSKLAR